MKFQTFIRLFDYENEAINSLVVGGHQSDPCISNDRQFSISFTFYEILVITELLV